jgi:hypothetical protein
MAGRVHGCGRMGAGGISNLDRVAVATDVKFFGTDLLFKGHNTFGICYQTS